MMEKVVNVFLSPPEQLRDEEDIAYPENEIEQDK
jgi:hypothetical protein